MRMGGVNGARQRQERSEHHTHKVLSRSQTCRAHRSRPSSLQGLLPGVFRWTRTSVHARWIVLLLHLLGLLEIWEVAALRTRASAHRDSLDVRIKTPWGSVRAGARGTWIKRICAPSRFPEEWNILQATLAAHMAFPNSPDSPGGGKPNPSVIDLGTILVDSDIIFGFTSHLLKRKTKVRMFYLHGCDAFFSRPHAFCAYFGQTWWEMVTADGDDRCPAFRTLNSIFNRPSSSQTCAQYCFKSCISPWINFYSVKIARRQSKMPPGRLRFLLLLLLLTEPEEIVSISLVHIIYNRILCGLSDKFHDK